MISDEMIHGSWAGLRRPARIETDTPIIPRAVAEAVWEEANVWLDEELSRQWVAELAERADVIYHHNARFRHLLRQPGNAGRDWLWAFTRHWLAGLIWRYRHDLYECLPRSYSAGRGLPNKPIQENPIRTP